MATWKILNNDPETWTELQEMTSLILSDCGYETEIEKEIETVRGKIEIDVYAKKAGEIPTIILCECKFWDSNIPQVVAHAFRTAVSDLGGNYGFIIAKKGFQSGIFEAVKNTNVQLFTWDQFQQRFILEWLQSVVNRNARMGKELQSFIMYIFQNRQNLNLSTNKCDALQQLREEHHDWLFYSMKDNYTHFNTGEISLTETVVRLPYATKDLKFEPKNLRDYFARIYEECKSEIKKIETLLDSNFTWDPINMLPY